MTLDEAEFRGLIRELARTIADGERASAVLSATGFPIERIPTFANFPSPMDFWRRACVELANGVVPDGLRKLFNEVARMFPGNFVFCPGAPQTIDVLPLLGGAVDLLLTQKIGTTNASPECGPEPSAQIGHSTVTVPPADQIHALAEEYPDVRDARALWVRAGGKASEVENISRPRDLWQRLWLHSMQGASVRPVALLKAALHGLPNNLVLLHYTTALETR